MVRHTDAADAESFVNTDADFAEDLTTRSPETATEVRMLIGAAVAAPFGSRLQGLDHSKTVVVESEDADGTPYVHGKIGITHTHDAAYSQAKRVINYAGGDVTAEYGKTTKKAGTHAVGFRFDLPTDVDETGETDAHGDADQPEAVTDGGVAEDEYTGDTPESLAGDLVDRFNSHGLRDEDVAIRSAACVTVDTTSSSHRGNVQEMTPGIFDTARRAGWKAQSVDFDDETITLRRRRD